MHYSEPPNTKSACNFRMKPLNNQGASNLHLELAHYWGGLQVQPAPDSGGCASTARRCRSLPHPMVRPVITPSQTAINPRTTLSNTFKKANRSSPSRRLWNVSSSNVENVVYAPMKQMGTRDNKFAFQCVLSARMVTIRPIRNDPEMLIANVPYGKRAPSRLLIYAPSQKRAMEPANTPRTTI